MNTTHTQGPWDWHQSKNDDGTHNGSVIYLERPGMAHCVCKAPRYQTDEQWEADACLIAAAPDMLEALENLENDDGSIPDHAWKLVQDAISKAKGESE
jgi:hypothetical protein